MRLFDTVHWEHPLPGWRCPHALWSQRVLLQSDPHHIKTFLQHLHAALPLVDALP